MSLVCSDRETIMVGKTSEKTDRFLGKIARLIPNSLAVWTTVIDPADPAFAVEMTIRTHLRPTPGRHRGDHGCQAYSCRDTPGRQQNELPTDA